MQKPDCFDPGVLFWFLECFFGHCTSLPWCRSACTPSISHQSRCFMALRQSSPILSVFVPAVHFVHRCHGENEFGFRPAHVGDVDHISNLRRPDVFQHLLPFRRGQLQCAVFGIEMRWVIRFSSRHRCWKETPKNGSQRTCLAATTRASLFRTHSTAGAGQIRQISHREHIHVRVSSCVGVSPASSLCRQFIVYCFSAPRHRGHNSSFAQTIFSRTYERM